MISKTRMLCAFTVFLFLGSLAIGSVSASYELFRTVPNEQLIPAETYGDDRRNEAVSILVYSEVADTLSGGEWENVMGSLITSLQGKFTYENLTDYTLLGSMIDEFDVLLLLESENGNYTFSDTVNAAWAGILPGYVNAGGIVIAMSIGYSASEYGSTAKMINGTLMDIYNPELANMHQIDVFDVNDALALNVATSFTGPFATMGFDVPDGVKVLEDNTNAKPVAVHKIMGEGHVVLLGFDMFAVEANVEAILANAVRLHRHVVFDASHTPYGTIFGAFEDFALNLRTYGFGVSSMPTFSVDSISACDILVVSRGTTVYNNTEVGIIEDFVNDGGGLFIVGEYGSLANNLDPLWTRLGYVRNATTGIQDTDDFVGGNNNWPEYEDDNIKIHAITVDVNHVEAYLGCGFIETPENSFSFLVTDSDGTAQYAAGPTVITEELPVGVASHHDMGRVVTCGDLNTFDSNFDTDIDGTINYFDGDNEIMAKNIMRWLSAAGIPEQTIVFDQSHSPWGYVHSQWNALANFMMFNGYNVEWMSTFSPTSYVNADILLICDGSTSYNTTEIGLIEDYVANGGGLLLWGNYGVLITELDPIGQEFNLHVNTTGFLRDSDDYEAFPSYIIYDGPNIGEHPIMDGVERIEIYGGGAFDSIGTGTELFKTDNDGTSTWNDDSPAGDLAVFAATTYEMGRVVFFTDIDLGRTIDGDSDGFGCLYDSDNPVFVANVLKWLAENRDPTVEVITPNGGEVINGTISVDWDAVDFDSDTMTFDVLYSDNNGSDWTLLADDIVVQEFEWNTTLHDDGIGYMIRVIVTVGVDSAQDDSDNPFELDNFVGGGGGLPIDSTTLLIIGAVILVVIVIVIVMKKKK